MFQAIFEKCADWLLPFCIGIAIWYGVHYVTLAPRIVKVDQQASYATFNHDKLLPEEVETCVKENISPITIDVARLEAALYTASLKHISEPYRLKLADVDKQLDQKCGVTISRKTETKRRKTINIQNEFKSNMKFFFNMMQELAQ